MSKEITDSDYDFFVEADLSGFVGEWVAIHNQKVISHGKDLDKVIMKLRQKHPKIQIPFVAKVHTGEAMLL